MMKSILSSSILSMALIGQSIAFVPSHMNSKGSFLTRSEINTILYENRNERREVMKSIANAVGIGSMMATTSAFPNFWAWADDEVVDDLAMPTEEEIKKQQDDEMAARLKRKAELQKKASKPLKFDESVKNEKAKQASMKKSKQEMRDALCEELGRGC